MTTRRLTNTLYHYTTLFRSTGAAEGKENHAYKSYEFARKYLERNNIKFSNIDLVLEAIKIHSDGFETNNIIALALILRSEEHTSELQSRGHLVCRLLLEKQK